MQDIIFQHICGHMGQGGSRARARFCANLCHVAFAKMSALENVSARARCTLQCWTFSKMVHITNTQMLKYVYKKIQVQKYKVHKYKKYENAKCKTTALENGFAQGKSTMDIRLILKCSRKSERVWWRADFQSGSRVLKKVF